MIRSMKPILCAPSSPRLKRAALCLVAALLLAGCGSSSKEPAAAPLPQAIIVDQWHTLTLAFQGPQSSEQARKNPFTDYRLLTPGHDDRSHQPVIEVAHEALFRKWGKSLSKRHDFMFIS